MKPIFNESDLPLEDLAAVGLANGGQLLLEEADLEALLAGRRTDMIRMQDLVAANGMRIASIDAKLSLRRDADGVPELVIHPIYLKAQRLPYLSKDEAEQLEKGEKASVLKELSDTGGNTSEVLVEFDQETKQFVTTETDKLEAPEEVNGQPLTPQQKAKFKRGEEVEMPDGTKVQHTATKREGLRANRIMLIASIVFDGGISYILFHSLKALYGQEHDAKSAEQSPAYQATAEEMKRQQGEDVLPELHLSGSNRDKEHSRGYGRQSAR